MFNEIINYFKDNSGATAIEYGLIVTLIALAAVGAMRALGINLSDEFTEISQTVENPIPADEADAGGRPNCQGDPIGTHGPGDCEGGGEGESTE